ncbi:hypothetical protein P3T21_007858, partial [Paraburkholderia sp. GAS334]
RLVQTLRIKLDQPDRQSTAQRQKWSFHTLWVDHDRSVFGWTNWSGTVEG